MIKQLTASTSEIDDVELALSQILTQLDLKNNLLKNTVGLVTCFSEFIDSGVYQSLCDVLPFEIVGTTTISSSVDGHIGSMLLTISVMTSDDVYFSVGQTPDLSIETDLDLVFQIAYTNAKVKLKQDPIMMLAYTPLIYNVGGEIMLTSLDAITNGLPIFGTISLDHTSDYHGASTLCNKSVSKTALVFVLIAGNVTPNFGIAAISADRIRRHRAIITKSNNNILESVNGISTKDYFLSLGLGSADGAIEGINVIPFVLDYKDDTLPVVRAMFSFTPEGYAVCGGNMPEKAILAIGSLDRDDILLTAKELIKGVVDENSSTALVIFSCVSRTLALGADPLAEMQEVSAVSKSVHYQFCYSGGEICPVYDQNKKKWVNRFHNDTIVFCNFK
ncbi:MAG: FIST C-terminal domain-containing protein [Christensenellaceae bacterium]|nr:FIST C-terminal domain-containing protein [Christensenellaceae bacterium]